MIVLLVLSMAGVLQQWHVEVVEAFPTITKTRTRTRKMIPATIDIHASSSFLLPLLGTTTRFSDLKAEHNNKHLNCVTTVVNNSNDINATISKTNSKDKNNNENKNKKRDYRKDNDDDHLHNDDGNNNRQQHGDHDDEILSCSIKSFYPFPPGTSTKLSSWLFRDIHQAIVIRSSSSSSRRKIVMMDFMTEGGATHPVWWDDQVKWHVYLGGTIQGEVRVRISGDKKDRESLSSLASSPKLERLVKFAQNDYDCNMNIYQNNCRMFCARMEREVKRLNHEDQNQPRINNNNNIVAIPTATSRTTNRVSNITPFGFCSECLQADALLVWRLINAALLPALYPIIILLICYNSLFFL